MGEPMRFAGKVDGWYYALTVGVNVMLAWPLASFFADPAKEGAFISAVVCLLCLVLCDIFITPTLLRNYVEFDGKGNLLIVFGFQKATYPVSKIRRLRPGELRATRRPPHKKPVARVVAQPVSIFLVGPAGLEPATKGL